MSRCQAATGSRQCRKTKDLTRTLITIHRESVFVAKLPANAIILLCPNHLQISPLEKIIASGIKEPGGDHV